MTVTSRQIIQRGTVAIDQQFFVPPGIIDVEQEQISDISESADFDSPEIEDAVDVGNVVYDGIPVVDSITVVSQTVKTAKGGQVTVDVVIEVPDFDGVSEYDVRTTKA